MKRHALTSDLRPGDAFTFPGDPEPIVHRVLEVREYGPLAVREIDGLRVGVCNGANPERVTVGFTNRRPKKTRGKCAKSQEGPHYNSGQPHYTRVEGDLRPAAWAFDLDAEVIRPSEMAKEYP